MSTHRRRRRHAVLLWWRKESRSVLLRSTDLLAASFFMRGHTAWRITPWDYAPWGEETALMLVVLRELCVSARGRHIDAEAGEVLRELRRPRLEVGEAARGMVQESPHRR